MSKLQRLKNIFVGLVMILYAYLMIKAPAEAYPVILAIIALGLMISGVKELLYYFFMARFMVGGRLSLYKGIIELDFGLLTGALTNVPTYYILLYLAMIHAFSGLVELLRANEAKSHGTKAWKSKLIHGIINLVIAVLCFIFIKNQNTAVIIYSIGLMYSGFLRFNSAFKKTTIIYIQ